MCSQIKRRDFLCESGATLLAGATASTRLGEAAVTVDGGEAKKTAVQRSSLAKRQNLILYLPDQMRADSLACYGNPVTKTPNFDRLASEGTRFENCHVQFPVCGASRCAMLTGWPTSVRGHRSLYYFLRPEEPNLFRYLRQAGYDVFWYGKNDALAAQTFYDSVTGWDDGANISGREYAKSKNLTPEAYSMLISATGDRRETYDYKMLKMALNVLERRESERPFCIFLPLFQPHPPYTAPSDFYDLYSPSSLPPLAPIGLQKKPDYYEGIREAYGLDKLDEATFRKVRAVYYGQVSYSDWLLGELMESMAKTGRDKDTALFVTSDHGDYSGDYGLVEKWPSGLEDCLTHVPLVARVPGGKQGVVADDMVEMFDVMQTSLEIAQTQANHTHFSRSLLPQIAGGKGDANRAAFCEGGYNVYEPQCFEVNGAGGGLYQAKIKLQNEQPLMVSRSSMMRTRTHKLIVRPQGQSELYDCKSDPSLTANLYGDNSTASLQLEMQSRLLDYYINTTGIAPMSKDPRDAPPYDPTRKELTPEGWQHSILDRR